MKYTIIVKKNYNFKCTTDQTTKLLNYSFEKSASSDLNKCSICPQNILS